MKIPGRWMFYSHSMSIWPIKPKNHAIKRGFLKITSLRVILQN